MIPLLSRLSGYMLLGMAVGMTLPLAVSLLSADGAQFSILLSATIFVCLGLLLRNIWGRKAIYRIQPRNSFWITALLWILIPITGSIPYMASGAVSSFTDAAFESFSGFTTTGATIFDYPEHLPPSLMLYRSMTQWIGGLGLILFLIAILKRLNIGTFNLYSAEFSGTLQRKLHPHISVSVHRLWLIYSLLTLLCFTALYFCGTRPLDALCLALSTISSGGFMTHSLGAATLGTTAQYVLSVFMTLSAINLALLFNFFFFRWRDLHRNEEFFHFVILFITAYLLSAFCLIHAGNPLPWSLRYAFFHIAATTSTCGFVTSAPVHWPVALSALTFVLMIIGSCSGSTGGGLKLKRIIILRKYLFNYILGIIHPKLITSVKIDDTTIHPQYINKILAFLFLYFVFIIVAAFIIVLSGYDIPNAISLAIANIGNLGPSPLLHNLGNPIDYPTLAPLVKWTLIILMVAGRVEIFVLLAVFSPSYWKKQ